MVSQLLAIGELHNRKSLLNRSKFNVSEVGFFTLKDPSKGL